MDENETIQLPTPDIGDISEDDGWYVDLGDDDNAWGFDTKAEAIHFSVVYTAVVAKFMEHAERDLDRLRAIEAAYRELAAVAHECVNDAAKDLMRSNLGTSEARDTADAVVRLSLALERISSALTGPKGGAR